MNRKRARARIVSKLKSRNSFEYYNRYYEVFREEYNYFLMEYASFLNATRNFHNSPISSHTLKELFAPQLFYVHVSFEK